MRREPMEPSLFWDGYESEHQWYSSVPKCGRAKGKSKAALNTNAELDKLYVTIHSAYKDLQLKSDNVLAVDVKNAFQGIASEQDMLVKHYEHLNEKFYKKVSTVPSTPINGIVWH